MSADPEPSASARTDDTDPLAELDRTRERLREVESELDSVGERRATTVADAVRRADRLLDGYADSAVGTGDFEAYLEFQEQFATLVEGLDDDAARRDAFEAALDVVDQRRLNERDFERAREALAPARDLVDLLGRREEASETYRDARRAVEERLEALDERIADLERLQRLGEADIDAPVEELREPIDAYNEAVREDFRTFKAEASARAVIEFVESTAAYPLVDARQPPADIAAYVRQKPAGEEPVPTLLSYADYSASKLDHYVDDPGALRARIATHRTYLDRIDAEPLTVAWPPRPAAELRYRAAELLSLLNGFAADETAAKLREVRASTRRENYQRLRTAAEARAELDAAERERLASGDVAADLERIRERRVELADALESSPEP